jgi:hypothetical protein
LQVSWRLDAGVPYEDGDSLAFRVMGRRPRRRQSELLPLARRHKLESLGSGPVPPIRDRQVFSRRPYDPVMAIWRSVREYLVAVARTCRSFALGLVFGVAGAIGLFLIWVRSDEGGRCSRRTAHSGIGRSGLARLL